MTDAREQMIIAQRIDRLLAEAAEQKQVPGDTLLARIMADAARVQTQQDARDAAPVRAGIARLVALLGGWPALGGFAMATCAGFWIGVSPPDGIDRLAATVWSDAVTVTVVSDGDPLGLEE